MILYKIIHYNPMIHYKSISILCIPWGWKFCNRHLYISIMCMYKIYMYICLSQLNNGGSLLVETYAVVLINSKSRRMQQTFGSVLEQEAFYGLVGSQHRPYEIMCRCLWPTRVSELEGDCFQAFQLLEWSFSYLSSLVREARMLDTLLQSHEPVLCHKVSA